MGKLTNSTQLIVRSDLPFPISQTHLKASTQQVVGKLTIEHSNRLFLVSQTHLKASTQQAMGKLTLVPSQDLHNGVLLRPFPNMSHTHISFP